RGLGGLPVDHELELRRALHRHVRWPGALQYPTRKAARAANRLPQAWSVGHEATSFGKFHKHRNGGKALFHREDTQLRSVIEHERRREQDDGVRLPSPCRFQRRVDLLRSSNLQALWSDRQRPCGGLRRLKLRGVEHRIAEDGDARERPDELLEKMQMPAP